MARTVLQAFETFKTNLEITTLQTSTVSTRQNNLRSKLGAALPITDTFLTGSYVRDTLIAPLYNADVDVFIVLDDKLRDNTLDGPSNILNKVRRAVSGCYTEATQSSRNGQAITIKFSDFLVDVVPAFKHQVNGYSIPDPAKRSWIRTDPISHITMWSDTNKLQNGRFKPLIKMLKAWNRSSNNSYLHSFHLESMIRSTFRYRLIESYPAACQYFFQNAMNHLVVDDPSGLGGLLSDYLTSDLASYLATSVSLGDAAKASQTAQYYNHLGNNEVAINQWKSIFGDYFPSYY